MRVELTRSGGFAGLTLQAALDTDELEPSQASAARDGLASLRWNEPPPPSPRGADFQQYQITVVDEAGQRRSTVLFEPDIPAELRPLVQQLVARGRLAR